MALKITTQIGTDKGITSEAYVRIADYQVSKFGHANFRIELFQKEEDKTSINTPAVGGGTARNQQIGEVLWVPLTKEVEKTRTVQKSVEVHVEATDTTPEHTTWEMQDVEETYTVTVPDLSPLEEGTIFSFAYSKLKEKLSADFGAEHIIDC